MEAPRFKIDDRFSIVLVTEDNYEEAYNCFIDGYVAEHPFFVAIKATREEIDFNFKQKYRNAFEARPLQQYAVIDTEEKDKIAGIFLTQHLVDIAEKQAEIEKVNLEKCEKSEVCKVKYEFDQKIFDLKIVQPYIDEVNETKNPMLYQQVSVSVLPQYSKFGFFFKMLYVAFYFCNKLGVKAFIDLIYNKVTGYMSVKYCGGKIMNDINVKEQVYKGEKVFDNDMIRAQMTYTPLTAPKTVEAINNDELYGQFYQDCVKYVEFMQTRKQLEKQTLEDAQN